MVTLLSMLWSSHSFACGRRRRIRGKAEHVALCSALLLSVSAILDRWAEDDPRWEALIAAV
jgi:hypothetical protein